MQQFFDFLITHWILSLALVVVLILLVLEETRSKVGGIMKIPAPQLTKMVNHEKAIVIDIRSTSQFDGGHIIGALSLPGESALNNPKRLVKQKSKPIIVVCQAGQSSVGLAGKLHKQGFEKVFSLAGGMNAWRRDSLPVVKK